MKEMNSVLGNRERKVLFTVEYEKSLLDSFCSIQFESDPIIVMITVVFSTSFLNYSVISLNLT